MKKLCLLLVSITVLSIVGFAQTKAKTLTSLFVSTPAFAEVLLKKTEVEADLESLLIEYTEEYPKVKENRFTFDLLKKEIEKLSKLDASQMPKLTLALGKLIVKKVEAEVDVKALLTIYDEKHPEVGRAKKRLSVYQKAVAEIIN
jgi:hypothetical protein